MVEIRPLGVKCNISCKYCYQEGVRNASSNRREYDIDAIKQSVLLKGGPFTLFGGEPLLIPKRDLRELLAWGQEQFGSSSIQTNAILIDDDHIQMFLEFNVNVGISIDGPGELNAARWAGSDQRTLEATARVEDAIAKLIGRGKRPSVICTLHRHNAGPERISYLCEWFRHLDRAGVGAARIHVLEIDNDDVRANLVLSSEETVAAMLRLDKLEREELQFLKFDLFREIRDLLLARDRSVSCVWRACDPYTTEAVQGIEGFGQASNCGRTNKAGVDFVKADEPGYERYLALYNASQADGGCRGCRFFLVCKGQCPGTAIAGDWRNRSENCEMWLSIYEAVEQRLVAQGYVPISTDPNRAVLETAMLNEWTNHRNPPLDYLLASMHNVASRSKPACNTTEAAVGHTVLGADDAS